MNAKQIAYYFLWAFKVFALKQKIPIMAGIIITDKCNLKCKHCILADLGRKNLSFGEITHSLCQLYNLGVKQLVISGGEPFVWRDGRYNVESIIKRAKNIGFFRVSLCTNGTFPLESRADFLLVSIDGLRDTHNKIRGKTFDRIISNVRKSNHKRIFANFTINKLNWGEFGDIIKLAKKEEKVKGIFINFHTPYSGVEDLFLPLEKRGKILDEILALKKEGYPVLNSTAGLKAMKNNNWKRPVDLAMLSDLGKIYPCCCRGEIVNSYACSNCGCAMAVEPAVINDGKISSILEPFRYL